MELIYGLHAVDALLRQQPDQVHCLFVQSGRNDKRMAAVLDLARNQGVRVEELARAELDGKVEGRHQGVIAQVQSSSRSWDEAALFALLDDLDHAAIHFFSC